MSLPFRTIIYGQRRIALANPCEQAEQCVDPRYRFTATPYPGLNCGLVLTVNIGQE